MIPFNTLIALVGLYSVISQAAEIDDVLLSSEAASQLCTSWKMPAGSGFFRNSGDGKDACDKATYGKTFSRNVMGFCHGRFGKVVHQIFERCVSQFDPGTYDKALADTCIGLFNGLSGNESGPGPETALVSCFNSIKGKTATGERQQAIQACSALFPTPGFVILKTLNERNSRALLCVGKAVTPAPKKSDMSLGECQGQLAELQNAIHNLKDISNSGMPKLEKMQDLVKDLPDEKSGATDAR
jgi:hypothetical protein